MAINIDAIDCHLLIVLLQSILADGLDELLYLGRQITGTTSSSSSSFCMLVNPNLLGTSNKGK